MSKVDVIVHGDKQWDFEPQVHDKENHTLLTPNLRRLPPCPGGATLKVGGRILGTVEKTINRGIAFIIVYNPHVPRKRKPRVADLELEATALEVELELLDAAVSEVKAESEEDVVKPTADDVAEAEPTSDDNL